MDQNDTYITIDQEFQAEYKEKGSKFQAYLFPCPTLEAFELRLESIKKEHFKARHHCYAYKIGYEGELYRQNDDGEPSGTAGKPIYGQLTKYETVFIGAVVVRYFGGTKLGTSGLIKAYKEATQAALDQATLLTVTRLAGVKVVFDYSQMGKVMQILKDLNLEIATTDFGATPSLQYGISYSQAEMSMLQFKAKYLNHGIESITDETILEGCSLEISK
jgi:uncharacterized YigZ family protein